MSCCPVLQQVLLWKKWLVTRLLFAQHLDSTALSGQVRYEGLQNIHRAGQPRKTPRFKQEIVFKHQAITTRHSLHSADPSAQSTARDVEAVCLASHVTTGES